MLRPTLTGPAAVPANLVTSISPATTSQSTPGAVVLTASATGGTGAQTWAWAATYADGTSAAALLSGSGSSVTLTTTTYSQSVTVVATATDSGTPTPQTATASALVATVTPANLTVSLSPANTSQSAPTGQLVTATVSGGVAPYTYTWGAKYSDGTNASALLSGSGASRTVTTTTPGQVVNVSVAVTDSGTPSAQTATGGAVVAVQQPAAPTLTGPSQSTVDAPGSASITFTGASGYGSLSYSASLSKPTGSTATLSGSGLGAYTFTTDLEGAYAVTLTLTDALGRTAAATGIVSLVSAGTIWTEAIRENFTTYDAATVTRTSSSAGTLTNTVNLQKSGVTQYVATLGTTFSGGSSGTGTAGIDSDGLYITQSGAITRASFTISPTLDSTQWQMFQWLIDMPSFSGTTVNGGPVVQSSSSPSTGTEVCPAVVYNNATPGLFDIQALMRLSNVTQTPAGEHVVGASNPGRICVTQVCRGKEILALVHDSDTFIPAQSIDTGPYHAAMSVTANDSTFSPSYTLMIPSPKFGIRIGTAAGTIKCREMRVLYATPRSS